MKHKMPHPNKIRPISMNLDQSPNLNKSPLISIVITSYTMASFQDICELLDSIRNQSVVSSPQSTVPLPDSRNIDSKLATNDYQTIIEVIFVADQSEELASAVERYLKENSFFNFKVLINKDEIGVNNCRNIGIKASSGEIVGLVDDDVVLFPNWAEEMVKSYLEDDSVVGVTGPAIPLWEEPQKMSWFPKELYFVWGCTVWDWDDVREIRNVGGMNCSFRREVLLQAGLYKLGIGPVGGEEKIKWFYPSGEEVELSLMVKRAFNPSKIIYNPKAGIYHKVPKARFNLSFILKRAFRFGYTKRHVEKHYQGFSNESTLKLEHEHLRYILSCSILDFWREFLRNPPFALKRLATVLLGTFFVGLGYFAYFVKPYKGKKK